MLGSRRISDSPAANSAAGVAFLGEACVSGVCSSFLLFWRPVDERRALGGASKAARLRTAPFASTVPNMGTSTNQKLLATRMTPNWALARHARLLGPGFLAPALDRGANRERHEQAQRHRHSSRVFATSPRGFARTARNG
jgi:hypothetical protein